MGKVLKTAGLLVVAVLLVCPVMASANGVGPIMVPGYLGDPGLVETAGQNVGAAQISASVISFCDNEFQDEIPCWTLDTSVLDSSDTFFISEGAPG